MNNAFNCPVCNHIQWRKYGVRRYQREATPPDEYNRIRHEVLFDIWCPEVEEVTLTPIGCCQCGFLCYSPRPDESDLNTKYRYINDHKSGGSEIENPRPSDKQRAQELFRFTANLLTAGPNSILDYGGANGRLLTDFVKAGHHCSVIDYVDRTPATIGYAGQNPEDVPQSTRFDLITCSHVIEHVADPVNMLEKLAALLTTDGHIYIEVPSEIWRRPPPKMDPVTHINFFTADSLRTLAETAGLNVLSCKYASFTRPNGLTGIAIKAIAKASGKEASRDISYSGLGEVERLLAARFPQRLLRLMRHPRMLTNLIRQPDQGVDH